jgi:hypothetical protein
MDMSLVMAALALQAGALQAKVGASVLKSSLDSQASAVQTLLGTPPQGGSSLANVATGVGSNLNIAA